MRKVICKDCGGISHTANTKCDTCMICPYCGGQVELKKSALQERWENFDARRGRRTGTKVYGD